MKKINGAKEKSTKCSNNVNHRMVKPALYSFASVTSFLFLA